MFFVECRLTDRVLGSANSNINIFLVSDPASNLYRDIRNAQPATPHQEAFMRAPGGDRENINPGFTLPPSVSPGPVLDPQDYGQSEEDSYEDCSCDGTELEEAEDSLKREGGGDEDPAGTIDTCVQRGVTVV